MFTALKYKMQDSFTKPFNIKNYCKKEQKGGSLFSAQRPKSKGSNQAINDKDFKAKTIAPQPLL